MGWFALERHSLGQVVDSLQELTNAGRGRCPGSMRPQMSKVWVQKIEETVNTGI